MVRKRSKRKRPPKSIKQLKEINKVEEKVFDRNTLLAISYFQNHKIFETLDYPISMGKEAVVFKATAESGNNVAVKIYRVENPTFINMYKYLKGDPRFSKIKKKRLDIILNWAKKEFANLRLAYRNKVHVPKPIKWRRNIVVMEFLGKHGIPYPTLQSYGPTDPEHPEYDFDQIINDIRMMYKIGLVHADISEYNIMITDDGPYIIDMAQAVLVKHPLSEQFIKKDVKNIIKYFDKYFKRELVELDNRKVLEYVKGKREEYR